jgi:chromosome segregation ATPase
MEELGLLPQGEIQRRKLSIHSLRKSFGSRKLAEGFSLHEVSKMLGHLSIQTTMIYLKLSEKEVLESYAEKSKEQDLDYITQLDAEKETRKVQKSQEDIAEDIERIDQELIEVNTEYRTRLSEGENTTHYRIRLEELTKEREELQNQLLTPKEQDLIEQLVQARKQIENLEKQLQYANSRMKDMPNYKFYEKKVKKSLKQQMMDRAKELAGNYTIKINKKGEEERHYDVGLGKVAEKVNEEFNTTFSRHTIKYWLNK